MRDYVYPAVANSSRCAWGKQVIIGSVARGAVSAGIAAARYHGALSARQRRKQQDAFMESQVSAMVATNAFGLRIDQPCIRCVLHAHTGQDGEILERMVFYAQTGRCRWHALHVRRMVPRVAAAGIAA